MKMELLNNGKMLWFECPGCGENHGITIANPGAPHPCWTWNGDLEKPTLSPSILARGVQSITDAEHKAWMAGAPLPEPRPYVCHSFVRGGMIEFLSDCTHSLAGQTVVLPEAEP